MPYTNKFYIPLDRVTYGIVASTFKTQSTMAKIQTQFLRKQNKKKFPP